MRLDQFLRLSRLVKRRPLAKSMADGVRWISGENGQSLLPGEYRDVLSLRLENKTLRIRVLGEARRNLSKKDASALFEILGESAHVPDENESLSGAPLDFLKRS